MQPYYSIVSETSTKLHNLVDELECHLSAAEILENNGIPQTIFFIKNMQVGYFEDVFSN